MAPRWFWLNGLIPGVPSVWTLNEGVHVGHALVQFPPGLVVQGEPPRARGPHPVILGQGVSEGVVEVTSEEPGSVGWFLKLVSVRIYLPIVGPDVVHPEISRTGPMHLIADREVAGRAINGVFESKVLVCVGSHKAIFKHFHGGHHSPVRDPVRLDNSYGGDVIGAGSVVGLQPEHMVAEAGGIVPAQVDASLRVQQQAGVVHPRLGMPRNPPVVVGVLLTDRVGEKVRVLRLEGPRPVVAAVAAPLGRLPPAVQLHLQAPGVGPGHPALVVRGGPHMAAALAGMDGVEALRLHRIQPHRPLGLLGLFVPLDLDHPREPRPDGKLRAERTARHQKPRCQQPPAIAHRLLTLPQVSDSTAEGSMLPSKGGWSTSGT